MKPFSSKGDRRGLITTAIAVVLVLSGLALIGATLATQRDAPRPAVSPNVATLNETRTSQHASFRQASATVGPILASSRPLALDIPAIDVHSDLQTVGQTATGALETPAPGPLYDTAAWYRHSPTPGSLGPAVLLGHVDSAANGPSVFFRLGELRPGDRVIVARADGSSAIFQVDEVHSYPKDDFPTDVVYSDIDHAGLRILTCGGAFDDASGHYLDNVVVFASLLDVRRTQAI